MEKDIRILFIGSFLQVDKSGGVGGQMYACNTLINSKLSENVEWIMLDSTAINNLHISFYWRLYKSFKRISKYFYFLTTKNVDAILIFSSHGFSFLEKGCMGIMGKFLNKGVIYAPRSGWLINEINTKRNKFIQYVFEKSDFVICQSENWKKIFTNNFKKIPDEKYVIIKNWIDVNGYPSERVNIETEVIILFLGWVERAKGIFDLIEAARNLVPVFPFIKFHIAGSGKDLQLAQSIVNELNLKEYFVFHGWVLNGEKYKLLQKSDIFVLPSYYEGLPNALIEAMASSLPCIATSVGAVNDIIEDGVNGNIIPSGDVTMLINKLKGLIESPALRRKMGEAARKEIINNHDINIALEKFTTIFSKLLENKKK